MKNVVATLLVVLALAGAAGFAAFRTGGDPAVKAALAHQDALEWLRADFQLDERQFTEIKRLHESYSAVCEVHCRDIQAAIRERNALQRAGAAAPALDAAEARVAELRLVCESAITAHVRQCAALMAPEAGARYLALVLPKIRDFDHTAAPDVHLNHRGH